MERLMSPLTEDELKKINNFYTLNKDLVTLPENVINLDTFMKSNKIFLEMLGELSSFEQTKAWMYLYKLAKTQTTNQKINTRSSSFYNYVSIAITVVILFVIVIPAFYYFVIREPSKSDYEKCVNQGKRYYVSIGAYPKLSDSKNVEKVIRERCYRSSGAFGTLE